MFFVHKVAIIPIYLKFTSDCTKCSNKLPKGPRSIEPNSIKSTNVNFYVKPPEPDDGIIKFYNANAKFYKQHGRLSDILIYFNCDFIL